MPPEEVESEVVETPATGSVEVDETAAPDPYDDPETDKFDRSYVEKLRQENAKHRTAAAPYKEVFDGFDDASRDWLLELAKDLKSQDAATRAAAGQRMRAVGEKLSPAQEAALEEAAAEAPPAGAEEEKPLTRAELEKFLQEKDQRKAEEAQIEGVFSEAETLGYKRGSREMADLMFIAANETGGDIGEAHKKVLGGVQAIVDDFVKSQQAAAEGTPVVPSAGGAPAPPSGEKPKTLKEAAEATSRRLDQAFGPRG